MNVIKLTPKAARRAMITDNELPQLTLRFKGASRTKIWEYVVHKPGKMRAVSFPPLRSDQQRIIHPKQKWRDLHEGRLASNDRHRYLETTFRYDHPVFFRVYPYFLEKPPAAREINHTIKNFLEHSDPRVKGAVSAGQFGTALLPVGNAYERVGSHDWDLLTFSGNCTDPSGPITLPSGRVIGPPDYSITYAELMQAILPHIAGRHVCWLENHQWFVAVEDRNDATKIEQRFG